jgi:restriction endonuclease S subunit
MKKGWQTKHFEDCIESVKYTRKIQRKDFLDDGQFPIVSQEAEFTNGYWDDEADVFKVSTPVVIFGDHTQVLKYVDFDFVLGADGVKILPPRDFLRPKFFFYQLQAVNFTSLGYARHYRLLKELEINYPPLAEQQRIVGLLDEAFEGLATAKANAQKNLQNARALFESHLQSVFTQRGPGWVETTLGDAYDVRDGTHDSPKYHATGFPLITSKNLKMEGLSFDNIKLISEKDYHDINKRSAVHKGDVLFAMIGTIGNPTLVEVEPNFAIKNVALFKMQQGQSGAFLRHYLGSSLVIDKMMREAKGTTQKFVGLGYLRAFPIDLPPLPTQLKLVGELDSLREETQRLARLYEQKLAALEALKKSLLHQAFSGEL